MSTEDIGVAIGEANIGEGGNNWKVNGKGVDNIYRLLPPLGDLANDGRWEFGHASHWGYENSDKKARLFECIEVKNMETKQITTVCPECSEHIAPMKAERDRKFQDAVAYLQTKQGMGKDQAERVANEKLKAYDQAVNRFNRSYRIYVNVVNEKGEIGVLNMAFRHLQLLKKKIAEFRKDGIDSFTPKQGVWFNFRYSGAADHTVDPVYVGNAMEGQKLKPGVLTMDILKQLKNKACLNLKDPWKAARLRKLTAEQMRALIKAKGDPNLVDTYFSRGEVNKMAGSDVEIPGLDLGSIDIPGIEASTPNTAAPVTQQAAPVQQSVTQTTTPPSAPLSPPEVKATDAEFDSLFGGLQ